ncbi:16S rRNA (cytidine(1402)-2'-O)-methyltransferase [candidate division WWE3 bacterium]|nr:16S rRNA (cytidine(1402)-2'-O)-methyltransferase [candidate division WWE3 bacterium]
MSILYIVATPIGNLSDISKHAIEVLRNSDLILSEDTRETEKVLQAFNIDTPQISYRDQNHHKIMPKILDELALGKTLSLVSDSGTPLISDPGFQLVRKLRALQTSKQNQIPFEIISIPGPSAVIAALSVSGLPTDNFSFLGFLPKKTTQQEKILKDFGALPSTLVIYESPFRVKRLLATIHETLGNRLVCLAKDLTKKYEKVVTAPVQDILSNASEIKEKGEYVVLVAKEGYTLE